MSSIAAATGINRETTRRKVIEIERAGYVVRSPKGRVSFAPGLSQQPETMDLVLKQLEAVARLVNDLLRDGSLKEANDPWDSA